MLSLKSLSIVLQRQHRAFWLVALAPLLLPGCSGASDPVSGSETHFLKRCNESCGAGLECVDGQCSMLCTNDKPCAQLNEAATCEQQPSGGSACELGCNEDSDCTAVLAELSCKEEVCRGPLWHVSAGPDDDVPDADVMDSSMGAVSDAPATCDEQLACLPSESMYFQLPELGLGTLRIEFTFDLGTAGFARCATEFADDVLTSSLCETDAVAPGELEQSCDDDIGCDYGRLRFDVRPEELEVRYWQTNGHQSLILEFTWVDEDYTLGPSECSVACTRAYAVQPLLSTKGGGACLHPDSECDFGLGCGDRQSALANAPDCGEPYATLLVGEGCGYDVLIFQQYIESSRAFYDRDTGALVGSWWRSDTGDVQCSGVVDAECTEGLDFVDICERTDAGPNDAGPFDTELE